jgi:metallophosphoesterase superfamily enzyme
LQYQQAAAFEAQCKKILKDRGTKIVNAGDKDDDLEVVSGKQQIALLFECKTDLWHGIAGNRDGFDVQAFENDDVVVTNEMGGTVDFFILTVDHVSVEKASVAQAKGIMRKVVSPCVGRTPTTPTEMNKYGRL